MRDSRTISLLLVWLLLGVALPVRAVEDATPDAAAVLSSRSPHYLEAFQEFEKAYGRAVSWSVVKEKKRGLGHKAPVIVTFGGKAAVRERRGSARIVYCLAPGVRLPESREGGAPVKVHMLPVPRRVVERLKRLQPGRHSLMVYWSSEDHSDFLRELTKEGARAGIRVSTRRLRDKRELPKALRAIRRKPDAIWLPPDPGIIDAQSFRTLKEYCRTHDVPLYVPTAGLVRRGAAASVSSSLRDIGAAAADAVRRILAGEAVPGDVHPVRATTTVNPAAAREMGLEFTPEALRGAERVEP